MDFPKENTKTFNSKQSFQRRGIPPDCEEKPWNIILVDSPIQRKNLIKTPFKLGIDTKRGDAELFEPEEHLKKQASARKTQPGFNIRFDRRRKKESVIRPEHGAVTNVRRDVLNYPASKRKHSRTRADAKGGPAQECWEPGGACFEFRLKRATELRIKESIIETVKRKLESVDILQAIRDEKVLNFKIQMEAPPHKSSRLSPIAQMNSHYRENLNSKFKILDSCEAQKRFLMGEIERMRRQIQLTMRELGKRSFQDFDPRPRNVGRAKGKEMQGGWRGDWDQRRPKKERLKQISTGVPQFELPDSTRGRVGGSGDCLAREYSKTQRMGAFPEPINKNHRNS